VKQLNEAKRGFEAKKIPAFPDLQITSIQFSDHEQLDKYVVQLLQRLYPSSGQRTGLVRLKNDHRAVYLLLKGYDTAYWMAFTREKNSSNGGGGASDVVDSKSKPLLMSSKDDSQECLCCPFYPFHPGEKIKQVVREVKRRQWITIPLIRSNEENTRGSLSLTFIDY